MSPDFRVLWGWDDVLVGLATVRRARRTVLACAQLMFEQLLMIGNAVCNPISRHYGYGRDTWRLPFDDTKAVYMIFYTGGILYAVGVASTKVAFLVFYIKLFPSGIFRWVALPLLVATVLHGLTFTFLFIFQCSPISYAWTQWDGTGQGKCLNFDLGAVMHAITNILLDLLIFALPIWQLWSLSLSKRKKVQVLSMFCVGFFVTLVSILRLWSMTSLGDTWNPTWDFVPFGYWSDLEFNVGIACICMPSLRVVLRRYFPRCGLTSTHRDGSVSGPDMAAARPVPVTLTQSSTGKVNGKSFRTSNRPVKGDGASDQVELCDYTAVAEPK
ncbi:hypothetical protein A1O7_06797 [Cladophialophora yegresii CBS 114405]|uniref:Rhodopsin domain-containing protein n=1 Tax=Cladophialophora yegresii CBS 114405 TaxID=1182544 RepID=W9VLR9_9EURO|nr:uncharacterized protein A1O7_06797 [Cladophialophora yegresii CBS 114405]EXJ56453.1 hypothetical protein A1O7_06797 [Cladophialophora yegresii CBS 114405]